MREFYRKREISFVNNLITVANWSAFDYDKVLFCMRFNINSIVERKDSIVTAYFVFTIDVKYHLQFIS